MPATNAATGATGRRSDGASPSVRPEVGAAGLGVVGEEGRALGDYPIQADALHRDASVRTRGSSGRMDRGDRLRQERQALLLEDPHRLAIAHRGEEGGPLLELLVYAPPAEARLAHPPARELE